jgi:hypothetical protein
VHLIFFHRGINIIQLIPLIILIKVLSTSVQATLFKASAAKISTNAHQKILHQAEEPWLASLSVALAAGLTCMGTLSAVSLCESHNQPLMDSNHSIPSHDNYTFDESSTPSLEDIFQAIQSSIIATSSNPAYNLNFSATSPAADADPVDMSEAEIKLEEATLRAKKHAGALKLFSGNGNMALSLEIAKILGIHLGKATVSRFPDGEVNVQIHENVRGKDVYIIQPTCPPVNDNIMELLLMVSTLNRASARRITVVIPYYGYARQDRKMQVRDTVWTLLL